MPEAGRGREAGFISRTAALLIDVVVIDLLVAAIGALSELIVDTLLIRPPRLLQRLSLSLPDRGALLAALLYRHRQAWHDKLAGAVVVYAKPARSRVLRVGLARHPASGVR